MAARHGLSAATMLRLQGAAGIARRRGRPWPQPAPLSDAQEEALALFDLGHSCAVAAQHAGLTAAELRRLVRRRGGDAARRPALGPRAQVMLGMLAAGEAPSAIAAVFNTSRRLVERLRDRFAGLLDPQHAGGQF